MPLLEWPTQLGVIGRGEFRMKQETEEDMLDLYPAGIVVRQLNVPTVMLP